MYPKRHSACHYKTQVTEKNSARAGIFSANTQKNLIRFVYLPNRVQDVAIKVGLQKKFPPEREFFLQTPKITSCCEHI
jgi:hypothetical protein